MNTPRQDRETTILLLNKHGVSSPIALVGIRGYYKQSMGDPRVNDRGIYDDAIFLVSPFVYAAFNANTDPTVYKPGIATLLPGIWHYKKGKHKFNSPKGYPALTQAAEVSVSRDGGDLIFTGFFGINIHRGSRSSTSSLGCQTIWPDQWDSFINLVYGEMDRCEVRVIPYLLVDNA